MIFVRARYGIFQEVGYDPHPIPIEYIEQHYEKPGQIGEFVPFPKYFVKVSRFTPFIKPSYIITRNKYKQMWKKALKDKYYKGRQRITITPVAG